MISLSLVLSAALLSAATPGGWRPLGEYAPASPPQGGLFVADLPAQPGLEVVIWAEGVLQCTGADGKVLWKSAPGMLSGPPQGLAATTETAYNERLLAVAAGESIHVLDGETGEERWKEAAGEGGLPWLAWADADQQAGRELIVAGPGLTVRGLNDSGLTLWTYDGIDFNPDAKLLAPMAWTDVDGDAISDGFGATSQGFFRMSAAGQFEWLVEVEDAVAAAPAVLYDESKAAYAVVVVSREAVYCLSADTGDPLWVAPLEHAPKTAAHTVCVDLDRDGAPDVAVATDAPELIAVAGGGKVLWRHPLEDAATGLLAADVDGDTRVDLMVERAGAPVQVFQCNGAAMTLTGPYPEAPSSLAAGDFNDDAMLDTMAICGAKFVALTSNLPVARELLPWPVPGATAEQGFAFAAPASSESILFSEELDLLRFGAFEYAEWSMEPVGWRLDEPANGTLSLDSATSFAGKGALGITPKSACKVYSQRIEIAPELRSVAVEMLGQHGEDCHTALEWLKGEVLLAEVPLKAAPQADSGWQRHTLASTLPPLEADGFRVVIHTGAQVSHWDNVTVPGSFKRLPRASIHVATSGYEYHGPKAFVLEANQKLGALPFEVFDAAGQSVFAGEVKECSRTFGDYGSDWESWYTSGDFTYAAHQGAFSIRTQVDGRTIQSAPFTILFDDYWTTLMPALWKPFLAPSANPESKWDALIAADPEAAARILWHLATGYFVTEWKSKAQAEANPGTPDRWREGLSYGAHALAAAFFASPPEDEAAAVRTAAALARSARVLPDASFRDQLLVLSRTLLDAKPEEPFRFELAMNLFMLTQDPYFRTAADAAFGSITPGTSPFIDSLLEYEAATGTVTTFPILVGRNEHTDVLLTETGSAFGITTFRRLGQLNFFNTPPNTVAGPAHPILLLDAALEAALSYRFTPRQEHLDFIYNQHRWFLGCNPADTPLVDLGGTGLITGTFQSVGVMDDRPRLEAAAESLPLEVQLLGNALFLDALSQIKRIPLVPPQNT